MKQYTREQVINLAKEIKASYKATDSGATGKTAERVICASLGLTPSVSKAGKKDAYKVIDGKRYSFEIKTTGGEVINYNNHKLDITNNAYVVYAPCYDTNKDLFKQFFVFNACEFFALMDDNGHIRRDKKTSNGYDKQDGYNRGAIKSFYHPLNLKDGQTLKRYNDILTLCKEYGKPLDKFIKDNGIKNAIIDLQATGRASATLARLFFCYRHFNALPR